MEVDATRNESFLVAAGSPTACTVARLLSLLAQPPFIYLTLPKTLSSLDIEIPSLRVGFTLDRGSVNLHSREFPSMCVGEDHSLSTMVGFQDQLLLTHSHTDEQKLFLLEGRTSCRSNMGALGSALRAAGGLCRCVRGSGPTLQSAFFRRRQATREVGRQRKHAEQARLGTSTRAYSILHAGSSHTEDGDGGSARDPQIRRYEVFQQAESGEHRHTGPDR